MKGYSGPMLTHLSGSLTRLATCILITRSDALTFGFTTHDRKLNIGGVDYLPTASFNPSDIASNNNMDTDNMSVVGLLDSATLSEDELRAGRWDYAAYRIFQVNWSDLSMGDKKDSTGHLGQCTAGRQTFVADLLGLMEAYATSIGELTQPGCLASLGDRRCKVNLTPFTVTGTVDTMLSDLFTFTDLARTEPDQYFNEGIVTWTGGPDPRITGLRNEIKGYITLLGVPTFVTKTDIKYDVTGATYSMTAGCDRLFATCRDRFNNVVNFRGFDKLRGNDVLMQVGRHNP